MFDYNSSFADEKDALLYAQLEKKKISTDFTLMNLKNHEETDILKKTLKADESSDDESSSDVQYMPRYAYDFDDTDDYFK